MSRCHSILIQALALVAVLFHAPDTKARDYEHQNEVAGWLGYFSDTPLSKNWALSFDSHLNTRAFAVVRGGMTYRTSAGPSFTGGYARVWTDPGNGVFSRNEHRPWGQIMMPFSFSDRWTLSQRLRADLRYQEKVEHRQPTSGWMVTPRLRTQTTASYWFAEYQNIHFFMQLAIETLINGGPHAGPNYLDQNRVSIMLGYEVQRITVRMGYLDRFVPGKEGTMPTHEHNAVLWFSYRGKMLMRNVLRLPEEANP